MRAAAGLLLAGVAASCAGPHGAPASPSGGSAAAGTVAGAATTVTEVEDLTDLAAELVDETGVPALGLGVWQDGALVGLGAAGLRAVGESQAVTGSDLWHLGSCTKAMTATLLALAEEQGRLSLDSTLGEFFRPHGIEVHPELATVQLVQLLDHTSGLAGQDGKLWMRYLFDDRPAREVRADLAVDLLSTPPAQTPGTFVYSNFGYALAGTALELTFDEDWETLMRRDLFEPLGMTSAGFGPPGWDPEAATTGDTLTQPLGHRPRGDTRRAIAPGPRADNPRWLGPAGTVHASLSDWARFLGAQLDGRGADGSPFLSEAVRARLHTAAPHRDYALGWGVARSAAGVEWTHAGSNTMWFALCRLDPSTGTARLATTNAGDEAARSACERAISRLVETPALASDT